MASSQAKDAESQVSKNEFFFLALIISSLHSFEFAISLFIVSGFSMKCLDLIFLEFAYKPSTKIETDFGS